MEPSTTLVTAGHRSDNVIPYGLKVPSVSISPDLISGILDTLDTPERVVLHDACGGFNDVVQVSAGSCLRVASLEIGPVRDQVLVGPTTLADFIATEGATTPFTNPAFATLQISKDRTYAIEVELNPVKLEFSDPKRVCIRLAGTVRILLWVREFDIPELEEPFDVPIPDPGPVYRSMRTMSSFDAARRRSFGGGAMRGRSGSGPGVAMAMSGGPMPMSGGPMPMSLAAWAYPAGSRLDVGEIGPIAPGGSGAWMDLLTVGTIEAEVCAPWDHVLTAAYARVDVFAQLAKGEATITVPTGDVERFYKRFFETRETWLLTRLTDRDQVHLCPTLSLVGPNGSTSPVIEFPDIEVSSFHVSSGSRQALTVAFDLQAGCQGIIEDVEHFIGSRDYGEISDERVIEGLIRNKWRHGGFDRSLRVTRTIRVNRGGNEEDATLRGRIALDLLTSVTVAVDADTRADFVRLSGYGRGIPEDVLLQDGTVVGPDKVDFGDPTNTPWSIFTLPSIVPQWSSDPEIREFQSRAYWDAYRFLARPFLRNPQWALVQYTRLEGVTQLFFGLGDIPTAFV
jgi:hypothetical protein